MIVRKQDIEAAQKEILLMILEQVKYGQQSKVVKEYKPQYFALGQFLGDLERTQRGVHGSATALRVLADTNEKDIVNGITRYLENRLDVEVHIPGIDEKIIMDKIERDDNNTIKQSEILYALSFIKPALTNTEDYIGKLTNKILKGQKNSGSSIGWRYFIDDDSNDLQLLPTAFAILALNKNGFTCTKEVEFLRQQISNAEINNPAMLAEVIFSLYSILKNSENYRTYKKVYDDIVNKIWKSEFATLKNNFEQNIEYWFKAHHEYIRIPWQLYLLSILSKISVWKFYSVKSQLLLGSIIHLAREKKFKYPYSGNYLSTRTNAVLYDVLSDINEKTSNSWVYNVLYNIQVNIDKIRRFFGSELVRYILIALGITMLVISIVSWLKGFYNGTSGFADVAPEFIGWIAIGLILLGKKK